MWIKTAWDKYRKLIMYVIFGGCTTLVNLAVYWLSAYILNINLEASTIIAWFIAVLFAYLTNRKWVFQSKAGACRKVIREVILFFTCRFATGVIDVVGMIILVEWLHIDDLFSKLVLNLLVIVMNYIASKLVVFKEKRIERY